MTAHNPKGTCFVISPIGSEGSEERKRADQVLKHIIKPAANDCGFNALRADEISEPGIITSQVIQHIVDDPLVVADLTGMNPNVFYELALRHAIRKPLIQIVEKNERLPFDVAGMRTIHLDHKDLDSVEESKDEIIKQIQNVSKKKPEDIESPVSVSLELQALRQSENPEERSFGEFVSAVTDLRSEILGIQKRLADPENLLPPRYLDAVLGSKLGRHREYDHLLFEVTHRLERILAESEMEPKSKKQHADLERIREMLMMLRHGLG